MQDLLQALDFVLLQLKDWKANGNLTDRQYQILDDQYQRRRKGIEEAKQSGREVAIDPDLPPAEECWSCGTGVSERDTHCFDCGAPMRGEPVQKLRYWKFLGRLLKQHEADGDIALANAHACVTDVREALAALRQRLGTDRIAQAISADAPLPPRRPAKPLPEATPVAPRAPRRPIMEILLDPRSIQWLLASGGVLLVAGLVIYLATLGIFENPIVVAVLMGTGTLAMLGGGWALVHFTRYQLAGRALTLLACLVMPLNLWYYHMQGLITLEGHLWVPALFVCMLYAASAWILRDSIFVYVLMGGVAMTGLLMLADMHKFEEIAAPSTLLMVLAIIGLHIERAFPDGEGPFTRKRFGMAFFWSGQALLAASLLLLLGAQLFGVMHETLVTYFGLQEVKLLASKPVIVTDAGLKLLAIGIVLAGTYAYLYSDLVVRRVGVYVYMAAFTILWAEVLLLEQLHLLDHPEAVIAVLALTALAVNFLSTVAGREAFFTRSFPALGLALSLPPVLWGVVLLFQATWLDLGPGAHYTPSWWYVGAMLLTAISCRAGAYFYRRSLAWVSAVYFFATAAATLVGAAGLLWVLGLTRWQDQAPLLMLIPIAYIVAARLYRGHTPENPLVWCAHAATAVMVVSSAVSTMLFKGFFGTVAGDPLNLALACFAAEAAIFYGLAAAFRQKGFNVYLATVMASGAVWQLFKFANVGNEYYTVAFALIGIALFIAYRLAVLERFQQGNLSRAMFQSANAWLSVAFVSAALQTIAELLTHQTNWTLAGLLVVLILLCLLAAGLVRQYAWRRWYLVLTVAEALLLAVMLHQLSRLTPWQQLELFSVIIGIGLLIVGHLGWYREQSAARQSDLVGFSLVFGSLLAGIPLAIATLYWRFISVEGISPINEMGLLAVAIALFVSGFLFQLRATTLTGGTLLVCEVVMLLVSAFLKVQEQVAIAIFLAAGGAVIFLTGLLLSIYRDRLLALPEKVKRREGVFRVLGWR
jgi:hypothetical protein